MCIVQFSTFGHINTLPAHDSGGAKYCNLFVTLSHYNVYSVANVAISCWPIMRKYFVSRMCVLPGWLMEQPSLFQTARNYVTASGQNDCGRSLLCTVALFQHNTTWMAARVGSSIQKRHAGIKSSLTSWNPLSTFSVSGSMTSAEHSSFVFLRLLAVTIAQTHLRWISPHRVCTSQNESTTTFLLYTTLPI